MLRKTTAMAGAMAIMLLALTTATAAETAPTPPPAVIGPDGRTEVAAPQANPPLLEFDQVQAAAWNGPPISADEARVCGASGPRRFLAEMLQGNPLDYKIPYRLGDIVAANPAPTALAGRQVMVSGTASSSVLGAGDFPFDHPFGSDFNMDVELDPLYVNLSQVGGVVTDVPQHVELSAGMFPHTVQPVSPPNDTWENFSTRARQNLQPGYVPAAGDRVIVMGRWINDCGHAPFQTELHPIGFMAWARDQGDRTVAQAFYAPYRETQLYHPNLATATNVYDPTRFADKLAMSFPQGLITEILAIQDLGPPEMPSIDHLFSYPMMEANTTSPADWWVCAPPGATGQFVGANWDFVARPGVEIQVYADHARGCVLVHSVLGTQKVPNPTMVECRLPWEFLNEVAGAEAGVPGLDLKAQLANFVFPQFRHRLDPEPLTGCFEPVQGPTVSANPTGQNVTTDSSTQAPFYGRLEVFKTDIEPPLPPVPSSTSSSSTSSSSSSSSNTTPAGQSITVTPATVAQGGTINVSSSGWAPSSTVTITIDGTTTLGTLVADANGNVAGTFTVPSSVAAGAHQVQASGTGNDGQPLVLSTSITVTAAPPTGTGTGNLPRTGASIAGKVAAACALVLVGLGLVMVTRRRPRPER